jgi:hypothetical protein
LAWGLLLPCPALADYVFGVSPIGPLDGSDPQITFSTYPLDSLDLGVDSGVGAILQDQIAGVLQVQLALRDRQQAEAVWFVGALPLGAHEWSIVPEPGDWRVVLRAADEFGNMSTLVGDEFHVRATSVQSGVRPFTLALERIAPNPFNPLTTLSLLVPSPGPVTLIIYNLQGQAVRTLVDGPLSAGQHQVVFNGAELPSGLYIARLAAGGRELSAKLSLLK